MNCYRVEITSDDARYACPTINAVDSAQADALARDYVVSLLEWPEDGTFFDTDVTRINRDNAEPAEIFDFVLQAVRTTPALLTDPEPSSNVLHVLHATGMTDADFAQLLGPQWKPLLSLVNRMDLLSASDIAALVAYRDATWNSPATAGQLPAMREAATTTWCKNRGVGWDVFDPEWGGNWTPPYAIGGFAARIAVSHTANSKSGGPGDVVKASDALRNSAMYAAWGLLVRDLIDTGQFTHSHYDTLTASWRNVIGPVHSDDPIAARKPEAP
jgi:hypothetical protein